MRTTARVAAITATAAAALTLAAGTASAGDGYSADDNRCKNPDGVVVVCTADQLVDLSDLDADVLNILNGHHHR